MSSVVCSLADLVYKKEELIRCLQSGGNINEQNASGYTALWCACDKNRVEIVRLLLDHQNIDVNLQSHAGYSPFLNTCYEGKYESVLLMLQDARTNVNLSDGDGWTPLIHACYKGKIRVVQLLLAFGRFVYLNQKSTGDFSQLKSGSTALDIAKQREYIDIVSLLNTYQANPLETQKSLRNQLHLKGILH